MTTPEELVSFGDDELNMRPAARPSADPDEIGELASRVVERAAASGRVLPDREADELDPSDHRRRVALLVEGYGCPYREAALVASRTYHLTNPLETAQKWLDRRIFGSLLVLAGSKGVGKTTAAVWAVDAGPPLAHPYREKWGDSERPQFVSAPELQRVGLYERGHRQLDALKRHSVLAIDDVGTEYVDEKGVFRSVFNELLTARASGSCWTIVTTNLTRGQFAERYGERIMERFALAGNGIVTCRGDSLRSK